MENCKHEHQTEFNNYIFCKNCALETSMLLEQANWSPPQKIKRKQKKKVR